MPLLSSDELASVYGAQSAPHAAVTVLVTGGTGLVGSALKKVFREEGGLLGDAGVGAGADERWIFVSSRDADLRYVTATRVTAIRASVTAMTTRVESRHAHAHAHPRARRSAAGHVGVVAVRRAAALSRPR
jgi:nucleoside-diphosphate-sugar epimerase